MMKLRHRCIVKYVDSFVHRDYLYLVMEYCDRGDLQQYLDRISAVDTVPESKVWKFFI